MFDKDISTFAEIVPKIFKQPLFLIAAGTHFTENQLIRYRDQQFREEDESFNIPVDTVFLYGKKDMYKSHFVSDKFYSREKLIIWYDGGHQFPKTLQGQEAEQMSEFVKKQYCRKYGEQGYETAIKTKQCAKL